MAESKLTCEERHIDDVTVLMLTGQITLDDGDLVFRRQIHDLLDRGRVKIVLDLGGVTYIDSSGIGMMADKLKMIRARGGDLKLLHVTSRSQRLLGTLKLRTAFETFDDEAVALHSFVWRSPR